ncbi:hypothetical protein P9B03_11515 [Metasolibacillus meyeri]|uniref:Lipoprotein n=1 Tax=Metasolibacillus meyeri TaxID=1071052 RepID=A0AAW9NRX6_9BACL|nr:hypothetical protein [Metasolibacillus meyeri]MEC1179112.1 hypothetical protein [Metasolibacillus meyeri]
MKKVLLSACFGLLLLAGCVDKAEKPKEEPVEKNDVAENQGQQEEEKVEVVTFEDVDAESKASVEKLVKKYNAMVEIMKQDEEEPVEIASMSEPITNELSEEENGFSQTLLDTDILGYEGHYTIIAKYNVEKKVTGYNLSVEGMELNLQDEEGDEMLEFFTSAAVLTGSLGLDIDLYEIEFSNALENDLDKHSFTNGNYTISANLEDFLAGDIVIDFDLTN